MWGLSSWTLSSTLQAWPAPWLLRDQTANGAEAGEGPAEGEFPPQSDPEPRRLSGRGHRSSIEGAPLLAGEGPSLSNIATPLRAHSGPEPHLGPQGLLANFGTARGLLGPLQDLGLASPLLSARSTGEASAVASLDTVGLPTLTLNADQVVPSRGRRISRVRGNSRVRQVNLTWVKLPGLEKELRDTLR